MKKDKEINKKLLETLKELIEEIDCKKLSCHFATDWKARDVIAEAETEICECKR